MQYLQMQQQQLAVRHEGSKDDSKRVQGLTNLAVYALAPRWWMYIQAWPKYQRPEAYSIILYADFLMAWQYWLTCLTDKLEAEEPEQSRWRREGLHLAATLHRGRTFDH
ncbi:unnamed protein product, partial [Scytosiphon promiscuus]